MTRRIARLFLLLGAVIAAYLVLSLFDHAARADSGPADHLGVKAAVASVKVPPAARKALPTSITPKAPPPKARTLKKILQGRRVSETVRRVQVRAAEARPRTSDVVLGAVRTAEGQHPELVELPRSQPSAGPRLPSRSELPGPPQGRTPTAGALPPPVAAQGWPCPPASGVIGPVTAPAAQVHLRTVPPRQPADRSTPAGQARDSGGGTAPATGTVPSSWRFEVAAAGCRPAPDLLARGRTVRYAGPPS